MAFRGHGAAWQGGPPVFYIIPHFCPGGEVAFAQEKGRDLLPAFGVSLFF